jgi:hypothetical protein
MNTAAEFTNMPEDLKTLAQWVLWRWERKTEGGLTKVPYSPNGRRASSTDPKTWTTFKQALSVHTCGRFDGIGCVVTKEDQFTGIDLDKCIDPESGEISSEATELVQKFDSYTEMTPSGEGLRIWIRGRKNGGRCSKPGIEIYDSGRYFTVTGRTLSGVRETIESRQEELDALIAEEFSEPESREQQPKGPYSGVPGERLDLAEFLATSGVTVLGEIVDGSAWRVFRVVCPWQHEHTGGDRSGTRVGQYADGALFFHCEHSHCSGRGWAEFRSEVDPEVSIKLKRCRARRVWSRS